MVVVVITSMPKHLKHIPAISHFFCWAEAFLLFLIFFPASLEQKAFPFIFFLMAARDLHTN